VFEKIFGEANLAGNTLPPVGLFAERSLWVFTDEEATAIASACDFSLAAIKFDLVTAPFACDIYGDLWVKRADGTVRKISTESFVAVEDYGSLESWAATIVADSDYELGWSMLSAWESTNGNIKVGERLAPKIPFVFGGEYSVENLYAMPLTEILKFRRHLATQTANIQNGTKVWIDTEDDNRS
jgi:hypothetical protein